MSLKESMQKKFNNLDDLNLTTNLLIIQELTKKWYDSRKDNKELKQLKDAIVQVSLITNKLQLDRGNYHICIDDYRSESLRLLSRARAADEKVKELEKQLAIYKKKEELGL